MKPFYAIELLFLSLVSGASINSAPKNGNVIETINGADYATGPGPYKGNSNVSPNVAGTLYFTVYPFRGYNCNDQLPYQQKDCQDGCWSCVQVPDPSASAQVSYDGACANGSINIEACGVNGCAVMYGLSHGQCYNYPTNIGRVSSIYHWCDNAYYTNPRSGCNPGGPVGS